MRLREIFVWGCVSGILDSRMTCILHAGDMISTGAAGQPSGQMLEPLEWGERRSLHEQRACLDMHAAWNTYDL